MRKRKLSVDLNQLANIGEFVGGIAVIASLLYLGFQVRQGTALSRAATTSDSLNQSASFSQAMALDKEACAMFFRGLADPEDLEEDEKAQFFFVMMAFMRRYENSAYQFHQGLLPESAWVGFYGNLVNLAPRPGFVRWWSGAQTGFAGDFRAVVDRAINESKASA